MDENPRSLPQALRHYLVNPLALGYLGVVLAACLWVTVDAVSASSSGDASFAGLWAVLATAPTSMVLLVAGPVGLIGVPIGAIVQAAALGALYRYITERRTHTTEGGISNALAHGSSSNPGRWPAAEGRAPRQRQPPTSRPSRAVRSAAIRHCQSCLAP
ncbi:SCO4225 family membrane protein [Streptomyces anulatus]|uniref:SCO4225 family membrane protein n=1 Tax=Streptomyces anulatus TaxID=1892 RepID=UPI003717AD86